MADARFDAARRALAEAERIAGLTSGRRAGSATGERDDAQRPPDGSDRTPGSQGSANPPDASSTADRSGEVLAREIVMRQLAMGPRSRRELADKLARKGCDPGVAERVLDRFGEAGLIDDREYAEFVVASRRRTKGSARDALRQELRRKGVDEDIVASATADITPADERVQAEALVARKMATMAGLDPATQARRLAGVLARRGYDGATAYTVIREAIENAPEHRRD